jgi:hypothetical protein
MRIVVDDGEVDAADLDRDIIADRLREDAVGLQID